MDIWALKMKVCIVLPILKHKYFEEITYNEFKNAARPDTEITVVSMERGPASIECWYDEGVASPWILEKVKEAEENGFNAVIIDCMDDPALYAARELVKIPVIGPCEASMALACILGYKFSIITVLKSVIPLFEKLANAYGFKSKMASVRSVEVPVLELDKKRTEVKAALLAESEKAIEEDGADVIILGCTGMIGMARELFDELGCPVIDPAIASLKLAEVLYEMGLSHSRKFYMIPPKKTRKI
jgi:allantoin racemase